MKQIRKRLTYANVMSSIAVFLVLGGAAFAATQLPKNSVGTKQLKKNAVNGSKVKNGSLTGSDINLAKLGTVPNATHASSADNATHASSADKAVGASMPETLASGKTLRGHYHMELNSGGAADPDYGASFSYAFPLPSTPKFHFIAQGEAPPAECPGSVEDPEAKPGNLCVYEGPVNFDSTVLEGTESNRFGFGLLMLVTEGSSFGWSIGSWAVTAP